jgi:hypothetical protein
MYHNPNTESPLLDTEDWEIAFRSYSHDHSAALVLGYNLMILKSYLVSDPLLLEEAIYSIDHAFEALFQHTQFHEVSYALFVKLAGGELTQEEQQMLEALGVVS